MIKLKGRSGRIARFLLLLLAVNESPSIGDLQGIAGKALQEIEGLGVPLLEAAETRVVFRYRAIGPITTKYGPI
jgi:hypothetical protein